MPEDGQFVRNMQHELTVVYNLLWLTAAHAILISFMSLEYIGTYI
jgi:NADH:ubiquinone oxidoreductase subunit D